MENDINTTLEVTSVQPLAPVHAPPAMAAEERTRSTQKVTWKVIVISILVSIASALLSAYLTLERVSHGPAGDLSEAAELARTLREDWRQLYQKSVDERAALEDRVNELNAQVAKLAAAIKQSETQLALVHANAPVSAEIRKRVEIAGKTNDGLRKQTSDILGDLGVQEIRILDSKKVK